jgi:O-antigen ligase
MNYYPTMPQIAAQPAVEKISWAERLLPWTAVMLLAGHMSAAMVTLHEKGQMPIKPRDFTILMTLVNVVLVMLNRPTLRPAALVLLILPTLRLADAGLLKRFVTIGGDHMTAVMTLANMWLVMGLTIAIFSTKNWQLIAVRTAITVMCINTGSILYEQAGYAVYTNIPGRPSGFLMQPNDAGIVMCAMLSVVLTVSRNFWLQAGMLGVALLGIGVTLSRSGILVLAILTMIWFVLNLRKHFVRLVVITGIAVPSIALGVAVMDQIVSSRNFGTDKNGKDRIEAITGMFSGQSADKMASAERQKDLYDGWEGVWLSPMWGHGTGCASSRWMPHNQWVASWLDIGIMGPMLLLLTLLAITAGVLMTKGQAVCTLVPLWLFTAFSQNLLEMASYWFVAITAVTILSKASFRLVLTR